MQCLCYQCVQYATFIEDNAMLFEAPAYGSYYKAQAQLLARAVIL